MRSDSDPQAPPAEAPAHPRDRAWEVLTAAPLRLALLVILGLLVVDLVLTPFARVSDAARATPPTSRAEVRRTLRPSAGSAAAWVLVGDSVLAGDVLSGRVDNWRELRVLDFMRQQAALNSDGSPPTIKQVALNGVLPSDLLGIHALLDEVDPSGQQALAVEINPRYFSKHHDGESACAHAWLCTAATSDAPAWRKAWDAGWEGTRDALDKMSSYLPVYRHRAALSDLPGLEDRVLPSEAPLADPLLARARLQPHYQDWMLKPGSDQVAAIEAMVGRAEANGRELVFFMTPINEQFFDGEVSDQSLARVSTTIGAAIARANAPTVRLVELDHPVFAPQLFVDHCHLLPEGNRLLARNLLIELKVPLNSLPTHAEVVHPVARGRNLVARIARGFSDGPSWVAMLREPSDVAIGPRGEVIIADTGNHALRIIDGNRQSVRTSVGHPGRKGKQDGPADTAKLDSPTSLAFVGDTLFFTTEGGASLRKLHGTQVETVDTTPMPSLATIVKLRAQGEALLLLDSQQVLWRFSPETGAARRLASAVGKRQIRTFASAPDGRVYIADERSRILLLKSKREVILRNDPVVDEGQETAPRHARGVEVIFANAGKRIKPAYKKGKPRPFFPFDFDKFKIEDVRDMIWVDRYAGLLVAYEDPVRERIGHPVTERVHIDFFDVEESRVFPWIRPRTFSSAHRMWNNRSKSFVSTYHLGSMALEQDSARLVYVERERSRVFEVEDGLIGTAKTANASTTATLSGLQELLGNRAGTETATRFDPLRFLDGGPEKLHGPFVIAIQSTSLMSMSDRLGMYSTSRAVERELKDRFAYLDGVGIEVVQRVKPGGSLGALVDHLAAALPTIRPDAIIVEGYQSVNPSKIKPMTDADMRAALEHLLALGRQYDAPVFLLDGTPTLSWHREGLRSPSKNMRRLYELAHEMGVEVIELGDAYLHEHLEHAPWGSAPFKSGHTEPWAIDATAAAIATYLYPRLRVAFRDRSPHWSRPAPPEPGERAPGIMHAYDSFPPELRKRYAALPEVDLSSVTVDGVFEVLVELPAKQGFQDGADAASSHEALAARAIAQALAENRPAGLTRLRVRLARMTNYDEYGAGVLEGASIEFDREFDPEQLRAFLESAPETP